MNSSLQRHRMDQMREANSVQGEFWLCRDQDGTLYLSVFKPRKDPKFGWLIPNKDRFMCLNDNWYPNVKWTDEEPTKMELK